MLVKQTILQLEIISQSIPRMKRMLSYNFSNFSDFDLFDVYQKEVRSLLEYAIPVWHSGPTRNSHFLHNKLEKFLARSLDVFEVYSLS